MAWYDAFEKVKPFVVRIGIDLDDGRQQFGTGFLLDYGNGSQVSAIATSFHVIEPAMEGNREITLRHETTHQETSLRITEDTARFDEKSDCATLFIPRNAIPFADELLYRTPSDEHRGPGFPVAWVGFAEPDFELLCFFSGHISCHVPGTGFYGIDGAAMHGISGGPLFTEFHGKVFILGTILGYGPERDPVEVLPGLTMAHDLSTSFGHVAELP